MKILVTGGYGFVGGRLVKHLDELGYEVILGSRIRRRRPEWCRNAKVAITNWNNKEALIKICKGADFVIHAAGMNARDCAADPAGAIMSNGVTTANLVGASIKTGVKKIIYLSTVHVYGNPLVGTITEELCPKSRHPYAISHRIGEDVVLEAHNEGKIEGIVFRLSNVFGAPTHRDVNAWSLVVNDICRQIVCNEKIVLKSTGEQYRDFVGFDALTKTICKALRSDFESLTDTVFNLGSGQSMSILEMANRVCQQYEIISGKKADIEREKAYDAEEFRKMVYSIEKLKMKDIFFESNFDTEINAVLQFCKKNFL